MTPVGFDLVIVAEDVQYSVGDEIGDFAIDQWPYSRACSTARGCETTRRRG
jgi:hypothetical protein